MNYPKSSVLLLFVGLLFSWSPSALALSCDANCWCTFNAQLPDGAVSVDEGSVAHYDCGAMIDPTFDHDQNCRNACAGALSSKQADVCAKIPSTELPAVVYATPNSHVGDGSIWGAVFTFIVSPAALAYELLTRGGGDPSAQQVSCNLPNQCAAGSPVGAVMPDCKGSGNVTPNGDQSGNVTGAAIAATGSSNQAAGLASNTPQHVGDSIVDAATAGGIGSGGIPTNTGKDAAAALAGGATNSNGSSGSGGASLGGGSSDSGLTASTDPSGMIQDAAVSGEMGGGAYAGGGKAGRAGSAGDSGFGFGSFGAGDKGAGGTNGSNEIGLQDAGRSLASAGGAMAGQDPADYFDRLKAGDNLFKIVERRIQTKSLAWDRAKLKEMK